MGDSVWVLSIRDSLERVHLPKGVAQSELRYSLRRVFIRLVGREHISCSFVHKCMSGPVAVLFASLHDDARGDSRHHFVLRLSLGAQPAGSGRVPGLLRRRGNLEHRKLPHNRRGVFPGSAISAAPAVSTEPSASCRGQELGSGGRGGRRGWIPPSVLLVLLLPELAEAAAATGGALSANAWSWRNGDVSRSNCAPGGAAGHVPL
jgi:hypothetical protein